MLHEKHVLDQVLKGLFHTSCAAVMLLSIQPAQAVDFSLKIEPGVTMALAPPQNEIYGLGGSQMVKALFGVTRFLDLGPSVSFMGLSPQDPLEPSGTAWTVGGGFRLKGPHDRAPEKSGFRAISPWLDLDAFYARSGVLNRPGFAAGAGLAIPIGHARSVWVGPFVRYVQLIQPEENNYDNRDAMLLTVGLSLDIGPGIKRAPVVVIPPVVAPPETRVATSDAASCLDRDKDSIADGIDHCPDVFGLMDSWGCPAYDKVIVKKDKLELKEKLYFAWDKATLEEPSFAILDEVVRALQENRGFRVQIEGHASSEGADDHNQSLSEMRASTVLTYLVVHGVKPDRLVSKGFSSSVPVDTNTTVAGRENNRRVEFVVSFIIIDAGSVK